MIDQTNILKSITTNSQFIMTRYVVYVFILFNVFNLDAQKSLTWDDLADISFEEKYDEEIEGYWLIPSFGSHIKNYHNNIVNVEGYLINLDLDYEVIILSKNPYSSCFFCGMAGPETIVEVHLKESINDIKIDQKAKIQGKLILNKTDFEHFNYILENASIELID